MPIICNSTVVLSVLTQTTLSQTTQFQGCLGRGAVPRLQGSAHLNFGKESIAVWV